MVQRSVAGQEKIQPINIHFLSESHSGLCAFSDTHVEDKK